MTKPAKGEISEEVKEKLQTEYDQVVTEVAEATSSMFWERSHGQPGVSGTSPWTSFCLYFLAWFCYPASDQCDLQGALSFMISVPLQWWLDKISALLTILGEQIMLGDDA